MNARSAREIRRGIVTARQVIRRERMAPRGIDAHRNGAGPLALFENAYWHTVLHRRAAPIPPSGPSGIGRARG